MPESNMPMGRAARSRSSVEGLIMVAGRRSGALVVSPTVRGTVQTGRRARPAALPAQATPEIKRRRCRSDTAGERGGEPGRHPGEDMGHGEDYRMELFIFPDGTAVEMIVFAQVCTPSQGSSRPTRDGDAGPAEREAKPGVKPTATHVPPPVGQEPGGAAPVSYTHLRAHETRHDLVC